MRISGKFQLDCISPVFIIEVVLVECPNEIDKILLHLLQIDQICVLLILPAEVVGEENASVVETFHC